MPTIKIQKLFQLQQLLRLRKSISRKFRVAENSLISKLCVIANAILQKVDGDEEEVLRFFRESNKVLMQSKTIFSNSYLQKQIFLGKNCIDP